jgi:regulatory factor X
MLSPIPAASVTSLRQLAVKMEKILLVALENYGNTFVEPKVELGARFGHLVSEYLFSYILCSILSGIF